jgi:hypothetical protein
VSPSQPRPSGRRPLPSATAHRLASKTARQHRAPLERVSDPQHLDGVSGEVAVQLFGFRVASGVLRDLVSYWDNENSEVGWLWIGDNGESGFDPISDVRVSKGNRR